MPAYSPDAAVTVTAHLADFPPALTVTSQVPSATPRTVSVAPLALTVATDSFEEVAVTVLSVASAGATVALRVALAPAATDRVALSRVSEATLTENPARPPW